MHSKGERPSPSAPLAAAFTSVSGGVIPSMMIVADAGEFNLLDAQFQSSSLATGNDVDSVVGEDHHRQWAVKGDGAAEDEVADVVGEVAAVRLKLLLETVGNKKK